MSSIGTASGWNEPNSSRSRSLESTVNLKDQPQWLWAIVGASIVCFVVSAVFLYWSRKEILDVVEKTLHPKY